MKKFLGVLTVILSLLLTLLIILVGAYLAVPSFKDKVNRIVKKPAVNVTVVNVPQTGADTSVPASPAAGSTTSVPSTQDVTPQTPITVPSSAEIPGTPIPEPTAAESSQVLSPDVDTGYVPPSENSLNIPDTLIGKTGGYEPVIPDLKTVPDDVADTLESTLDYGNTGDGLDFDPLMYPYYHILDDVSKHLYRQIYANNCDLYDDFKAVEPAASPAQVKNAFTAVWNDHPELFYADTKFSAAFRGNGDCLELKLYFNDLAGSIDSTKAQFEDAANAVKNASSGSPYDMEKAAHDALANMDSYSIPAPYNQSAYSALVNGRTVCAGYSRAMQYVMQQAGIPCYYCSGYAGENHAWNIICLDDEFYNLDVTWDDTDDSSVCNYDWFNKTDADYAGSHVRRDLSVYLPPCNGTKYGNLESNPAPAENPQNNTPVQPSEDLRSLADLGMDESDVIKDLNAYYEKCKDLLINDDGSHDFDVVVDSAALCEQIAAAYNNNSASDNLLRPAISELGYKTINMRVYPEELEDGRYLLSHKYTVN